MYELFEHTADLGLRIRAPTLNDLFRDAARALFSAIAANPDSIPASELHRVQVRQVSVSGDRLDFLLFDWLSELLYLFETEHLVFFQYEVRVDAGETAHDNQANGKCYGIPLEVLADRLEHEVKAITYHELRVEHTESGWLAEVIVDI